MNAKTNFYITGFLIALLIFGFGVSIGSSEGLHTCLTIGNNIMKKMLNISLNEEGIRFIEQNYKTSQYLLP